MKALRTALIKPILSQRRGDRQLVLLVVLVSLGLSALTVWAVARQGRALQERDWADLRNEAGAAAAERSSAARADAARALDAAETLLQTEGPAGLDRWLDHEHRWSFLAAVGPGEAILLPRTPTQAASASAPADDGVPKYEPDASIDEVRETLERCRQLASSADGQVRVRASLTAADCCRHLGEFDAAVTVLETAGRLLKDEPPVGGAFQLQAEVIGCLAEAEAARPARLQLTGLLTEMEQAHPARYTAEEIEFLRRRAGNVLSGADAADLNRRIEGLVARAALRKGGPEVLSAARAWCAEPGGADDGSVAFQLVPAGEGGGQVLAVRKTGPDACVVLAQNLADLLSRYWADAADQPWRIVRSPAADAVVLAQLDDSFGGAALVAGDAVLKDMRSHARRRELLVVATAAGTAGAWGVVIWMMLRAMAHQRELVRLQRRFVADVSHELKTPLAMIRLLAETLQDGRVSDPERMRSYHGTITREAERLSVLLDSILDFSRIESGRRQYVFEACDFAAVARQVWALFEPQFAGAGFEQRLEIEPDLPVVRADATAVQQVIVNLLQNAFRYAGDGKYVRLAVNRDGYVIVVTVEDHGIGMTRSQLQRLGDTFFRAEDTRVRQTRGSGLGLAIVNHIVRAHGGKMEVHSRPNRGSTFTVWFPFEPDEAGK